MLIKFAKTDPRAGTIAQLDSNLAHQFIAAGVATEHKEREAAHEEGAQQVEAAQEAAKKPGRKAKADE